MSETVNKKLDSLFLFKKGTNEFNASIINDNPGNIPVYSGATKNNGIIGYTNQVQYDGKFIRVITVGMAGKSSVISGKFCLAQNNGILILKSDVKDLDLNYVALTLNSLLPRLAKGDNQKSLIWKDFRDVSISIPICSDGTFDLELQKELVKKYVNVGQQKNTLLNKIEELKKYKIVFEEDKSITYKKVPLNDMIVHCNGNANYTKEWCNLHAGIIPMYSANNREPFAYSDTADFEGCFLTYSKNGCAGYINILEGKFSINGDRCVIRINDEFKHVNLQYLKYFLEPIFRKNIKGRIGINGKNEYTKINSTMIKKLNILVPIPTKTDGTFDIEKQQELASKYAVVETIRKNIYNQIRELTSKIIC